MKSEFMKIFRAFTDENRIQILETLCKGEECACVLLHELQISQPTLSHHMRILCESGIVKSRRVGKWNYYSINESGCDRAMELMKCVKKKDMDSIQDWIRAAAALYRKKRCFRTPFRALRRLKDNTTYPDRCPEVK